MLFRSIVSLKSQIQLSVPSPSQIQNVGLLSQEKASLLSPSPVSASPSLHISQLKSLESTTSESVDEGMTSSPVKHRNAVSFALVPSSDSEDYESGEDAQPILSVEQYAAQAYADTNVEDTESSDIIEESDDENILMQDAPLEDGVSLTQEMDSILGMSQYRDESAPKHRVIDPYGMSSPLHNLATDPSFREASTVNALLRLEQASSQ